MERIMRTILFDYEDAEEKTADIRYARTKLIDWCKFKFEKENSELKGKLNRSHIPTVKPKIIKYGLNKSDETLRIYVYRSKLCHIVEIDPVEASHAIQVSVNDIVFRTGWVNGENNFSAKVFIDEREKIIQIVEDILMDIQMFYIDSFDIEYSDFSERRKFSEYKTQFIVEKEKTSYFGELKDAEYISFASFCRDKSGINYEEYVNLWDDFKQWLSKKNDIESHLIISFDNVSDILKKHPKGKQLSLRKIEKILSFLSDGRYYLLRTEKKPNSIKQFKEISTFFGMKNWKTGKIRIVPQSERYRWIRLKPYISLFEFEWKGFPNHEKS